MPILALSEDLRFSWPGKSLPASIGKVTKTLTRVDNPLQTSLLEIPPFNFLNSESGALTARFRQKLLLSVRKMLFGASIFLLLFSAGLSPASAGQANSDKQNQAAENDASTSPPPYLFDLMNAPTGTAPAPPGLPSPLQEAASANRTEYFFDVFYASSSATTATVTASSAPGCFILCGTPTTTTASRSQRFNSGDAIGFRWGGWGAGKYKNLGLGLELTYFNQEASEVSVNYVPFTLEGMVRFNFLPSDDVPSGRLQVHGGIGLSWVLFGNLDVHFPELEQPVSGGAGGSGTSLFLGLSWRYSHFALFTEMRLTKIDLEYSSENDFLSFGSQEADVSLDTKLMVFGLTYLY